MARSSPKIPQDGHKTPQHGSTMAPRYPKMAPKGYKMAARWPQIKQQIWLFSEGGRSDSRGLGILGLQEDSGHLRNKIHRDSDHHLQVKGSAEWRKPAKYHSLACGLNM